MSEPGREQDAGNGPRGPEAEAQGPGAESQGPVISRQGPGTGWVPVQPSAPAQVPAGGEAGTAPLPQAWSESFAPQPQPAPTVGPGQLPPAGAPQPVPAAAAAAGSGAGLEPAAGPKSSGWRAAFRRWRRSRPFWGGLVVLIGGAEILLTYHAAFGLVVHFGLYGLAGYLVPALLGVLGLLIIFDPVHRTFYSVLSVLAALGTWLTSNLGGFVLGMLLGVVGGSLAFGWQPGPRRVRKRRRVGAGATG